MLTYTPDSDVAVHAEGAIRLICTSYQSHESGLPEWLKNAADVYVRNDVPAQRRIIVLFLNRGKKGKPGSIGCLDFYGMTSNILENEFRKWADPGAATRDGASEDIQGGHGNGGKCYMTQMFEQYAEIVTVRNGHANRYGVNAGSIAFGYVPDRRRGRNAPARSLHADLGDALSIMGCSIGELPSASLEALQANNGFTLVVGVGPKGYASSFPAKALIETLQNHPQMIRTLELCDVYVCLNGRPYAEAWPMQLSTIPPMAGGEQPRVISIPDALQDPMNGETVSIPKTDIDDGKLVLQTADRSMRWSLKARHIIAYRGRSGYVGYVPITELDVVSRYRDRIYGTAFLKCLDDYKQNDRARLSQSPIIRALEAFIAEQIQQYAQEFEVHDRRQRDQEEEAAVSRMNEALDLWKNRFLNRANGLVGTGPGPIPPPPPPPPLPDGRVTRIDMLLSHCMAGIGVSFRPVLRFFESNDRQVRRSPYRIVSADPSVASVDEDLMVVTSKSIGSTAIWVESFDGRVKSNALQLDVVPLAAIRLEPLSLDLEVGTRQQLRAFCRLADGSESDDVYLTWTENDAAIAHVMASGVVYAYAPGSTTVAAGDDRTMADEEAAVVVKERTGSGSGNNRNGSGYPRVLISEYNHDPETDDVVVFRSDEPPVAQRPQDVESNTWWVNSAAPFARLYLDEKSGYGYASREWRIYLLERYIDVMVQITLTMNRAQERFGSLDDWLQQWGVQAAEMQALAVTDLGAFIASGELPVPNE
jgi:hypothetical protein